jgi:uncharacterized protein (DUF952 family)
LAFVFKVLSQEEWAAAEREGVFRGAEIDRRDGYIHFSTAKQLERTVELYFTGRDDLVLAAVEAEAIGDALRWEPSRGGDLFPHLYSELPLSSIAWVRRFSSREPGVLRSLIANGP